MKKYLVAFVLIVAFSCKKESKGFDEKKLLKPVDFGEYHAIGQSGLKVFLPEGFKALTESDKQAIVDAIEDEKTRDYVKKNYNMRKFATVDFYDFYNFELSSDIIVATLPYMPFSKQNAKELLYYIRKANEKEEEVTDIYHEKVKATYSGGTDFQMFKAIYMLKTYDEVKKEYVDMLYKTVYLISSNKKTFSLTITTPYELDFDPFIKKTKL